MLIKRRILSTVAQKVAFKIINYFCALLLAFVMATICSDALAEKVIGKVYLDDDGEPISSEDDSTAPNLQTPKVDSPSKWSYSLGLGGGYSSFYGSFTADYFVNQYVVPQIALTYYSIDLEKRQQTRAEFNYPIILYAANGSFFWPFVGAGPGYSRWTQADEYGNYDSHSSLTGIYFYGIKLKFTEHFSLIIQNRMTNYLNKPPVKTVSNRGTDDETYTYQDSTVSEFSYNFFVSF
jgi:hypothetical protein